MPPFDGNLLQMPPGMNPVMGDLASAAWQLPFSDRMPGIEPSQLSFGDIFQQLGAARGAEQSPEQMENLFKNASDINFTSPAQNQHSGRQPDFFLNQQGKMVKNPNAEPLRPGQPLNIEIQSNAGEFAPELQNAIQSILDTFNKFHQNLPNFPRSWEDVMRMLARAAQTEAGKNSDDGDSGSMERACNESSGDAGYGGEDGGFSAGGSGRGGGGGGEGGSRGRFGSAGADSAGARRVSNAPSVPWDGKSKGDMNLVNLSEQAAQQGRQLWAETPWAGACRGGDIGCAASVSKVLQEGGYSYAGDPGVLNLAGQLTANGWSESTGPEGAQPGDVIYGDGGNDNQHIGIVGVDEKGNLVIYNNHSDTGVWTKDPFNNCSIISGFGQGQIHVLHAPAPASRA